LLTFPSIVKNKNANALPSLAKSIKILNNHNEKQNLKHFAPTPTQKQLTIFIFNPKQSNIIEVIILKCLSMVH